MAAQQTLDQIASNSGMNVAHLIGAMIKRKMRPKRHLSEDEVHEVHELISDIYDLGSGDKAKLLELLKTDQGRLILQKLSPFYGAIEEKKFVRALSESIMRTFGNEIRGINPEIDQAALERTVFNIGPKRILSIGSSQESEHLEPNKELLHADPKLTYTLLQKTLRHAIEIETSSVYSDVMKRVDQISGELREKIRRDFSGSSAGERKSLERILQTTFDRLDEETHKIVEFKEGLDSQSTNGLRPKWHQALRMFHLTEKNKDDEYVMKRAIIADCTAAGKTFSLIASYGLLKREQIRKGNKKGLKGLIISPKQALHSVWGKLAERDDGTREWDINKYMRALGLPNLNVLKIERLEDLKRIDREDVDLVLINYEKLALETTSEEKTDAGSESREDIKNSGEYLKGLIQRAEDFLSVIVDEGHNLKNTRSKRSGSMIELIEKTKNSHFWIASATTIPNRTKDAGFLLYMLDPKRFKQYRDKVFDIRDDEFSIPNMVNSSNWFRLDLPDLQNIFGIGPMPYSISRNDPKSLESKVYTEALRRGIRVSEDEIPAIYEMDRGVAEEYFQAWKDMDSRDLTRLPQILLRGSIPYLTNITTDILSKDPKSRVTLFSHHKTCFVEEMIDSLVAAGINRQHIGIINGDESAEKREETADRYKKGIVRVILCSSQVSESFSLTTGEDKNYFIFAEPPFVPGVYEQALGRGYRNGQNGDVITIHPIPHSSWLEQRMLSFKNEQEEINPEMKIRRSFTPTNIFEDAWTARQEKKEKNALAMKLRGDLSLLESSETDEDEEVKSFPSLDLHKSTRDIENQQRAFMRGFQSARSFQGKPVEELMAKGDSLVRGYTVSGLMNSEEYVFAPKSTAGAIQKIIEAVDKALMDQNRGYRLEKILDVGCGTAVLARQLTRPIISLDCWDKMIDGGMTFLKQERKEYGVMTYDSSKSSPQSPQERAEVSKLLEKLDSNNLLVQAHAQDMPFEDGAIDFISMSYAHMYNQQDFERRDMENIFLEFNRVLREGGYGLLTLPGETTRESHKETFDKLIQAYGFKVVFANYISDTERAKRGSGPFSILFEKISKKSTLHDWDEPRGNPEIPYYRECLIGGKSSDRRRNICLAGRIKGPNSSEDFVACTRMQGGTKKAYTVIAPLQDHIYEKVMNSGD